MEHLLNPALLQRRVSIDLIGVGGNGAQMASKLARLDVAMRALGHPAGLHVTAYDGARVSPSNVGRQVFSPSDIGLHKALVMIDRINNFYGFDWRALPHPIQAKWGDAISSQRANADITISCVDTRAARRSIHRHLFGGGKRGYWLDLGNADHNGQVVLGQPNAPLSDPNWREAGPQRLPCVTELYPALLDETILDDNKPSCTAAISLAAQGLFVNDTAVVFAAQLLYELFSQGRIAHHGVIFDLAAKRCGPLAVDPACWRQFGLCAEPDDAAHDAAHDIPAAKAA